MLFLEEDARLCPATAQRHPAAHWRRMRMRHGSPAPHAAFAGVQAE
jgi:hypothetical protein